MVDKASSTNFRGKLQIVNSTKILILDLTKILLSKSLIFMDCLIAEVIHYHSFFYRIEIEQVVFKLCPVLFR